MVETLWAEVDVFLCVSDGRRRRLPTTPNYMRQHCKFGQILSSSLWNRPYHVHKLSVGVRKLQLENYSSQRFSHKEKQKIAFKPLFGDFVVTYALHTLYDRSLESPWSNPIRHNWFFRYLSWLRRYERKSAFFFASQTESGVAHQLQQMHQHCKFC